MTSNLNFMVALLVVVAIVSLAFLTRGCGHAKVPAYFDTKVTLEEAVARSAASGKPVLALVSADWCAPCSEFKKGALRDSRVAAWITENTEPVYIDMSRPPGRDPGAQEVRDRLHVQAFPSIVILSRGNYAGKLEGAAPAKELLGWLGRVKAELEREAAASGSG